jgi:hypothetical protein
MKGNRIKRMQTDFEPVQWGSGLNWVLSNCEEAALKLGLRFGGDDHGGKGRDSMRVSEGWRRLSK